MSGYVLVCHSLVLQDWINLAPESSDGYSATSFQPWSVYSA